MTHDHEPPTRLGRRAVLTGAAASAGLVLFGSAPSAEARSAPTTGPNVSAAPSGDLAWVATGDAAHVLVPAGLGALLTPTGAALPAGTRVDVSWDTRLYERSTASLVGDDGRAVRVDVTVASAAGSLSAATVTLRETLRRGQSYRLLLGARRTLRYPDDVVAAPVGTSVQVADASPAAAAAPRAATGAAALAVADRTELWGAAIGAGWRDVPLDGGRRAWLPELVTVRSTGPSAVPAGTHVDVLLDGRLFTGLQLTPPDGDAVRAQPVAGTTVRLRWALAAPLPADERRTAHLTGEPRTQTGTLADLQPPTVSVRAARRSVGQRTTGLESLSRDD